MVISLKQIDFDSVKLAKSLGKQGGFMELDILISLLIGILLILLLILTLPIWICYTLLKRLDFSFIKKFYIMWLEE